MNASAFWDHVDRSAGPTACWPWTGARIGTGYGQLRIGRRRILAHRLAYTLAAADIPDGLCVLHSCDNPICCNPAHLRAGSHLDNRHDCAARGRARVRPVITPDQILAVRQAAAAGATNRQLAAEYGVRYAVIFRMVTRRTFRNLEDPT